MDKRNRDLKIETNGISNLDRTFILASTRGISGCCFTSATSPRWSVWSLGTLSSGLLLGLADPQDTKSAVVSDTNSSFLRPRVSVWENDTDMPNDDWSDLDYIESSDYSTEK
jgi:hypothetical protein